MMLTFLLTDIFFYIIFISLILYINYVRKTQDIKETWSYVFKKKTGIISIVVLSFFMLTALLDSIHIKEKFTMMKKRICLFTGNKKRFRYYLNAYIYKYRKELLFSIFFIFIF